MKGLVKKAPTVQIPPELYDRVLKFEGGKYTPKSVIVTAVEEWLDAKERAAGAPVPVVVEGAVQS